MKTLRITLAVVAAGIAAFPFTANAATAPSLRALPSASVLTLSGHGFASGERLTLTIVSGHPYRLKVAVTPSGTFTVRVAGRPRCAAWTATATSSDTSLLRFRSDVLECRQTVAPGPPTIVEPGPPAIIAPGPPTTGTGAATVIVREHFEPGG
jgi:hypothetical protein